MGESKVNHGCAFCNNFNLEEIINFGEMALAGSFLKEDQFETEEKFFMRVGFCKDCYAVQILDSIDPDTMFRNYFYFSSSIRTLKDHFQAYADEMKERFLTSHSSKVLEFGCNDGVLLKPLADLDIETVIGIDPAENVISTIKDPRIDTICDYFNEKVADDILQKYDSVDLVIANNAYAHIDDIQGTTKAVKKVLNKDGVFVFEVHYLGGVIEGLQYDMIYHEHIYYYSLLSLIEHFNRYNMTVFDIKPIQIHGGSYRFYICNKGSKFSNTISSAVKELKAIEIQKKYNSLETYKAFSGNIHELKKDLICLLSSLKENGKSIVGYGASGRANTIIQFCDLGGDIIDYMIDDAPAKHGFYTPGSHLEIRSNDCLYGDNPPDYVIVFAWAFFDEIKEKNKEYLNNGGKFILPLPKVSVFS